jgi:hypothetical protein
MLLPVVKSESLEHWNQHVLGRFKDLKEKREWRDIIIIIIVIIFVLGQFQILAIVHQSIPLDCHYIFYVNSHLHLYISVWWHSIFVAQQNWSVDAAVS